MCSDEAEPLEVPDSAERKPTIVARPSKHRMVSDTIQESIRRGDLQDGDKLGSELELAERLDVSRGTVRRALEQLANDGLIRTERGRGSFVTYSGQRLDERVGWASALLGVGIEASVEILRLAVITDGALSIHLGTHNARFVALDRVRRLPDGTPISLERSRVAASEALVELVDSVGLVNGSLMQTLAAAGLHSSGGEQWLQAVPLDDVDAEILQAPAGSLYLHALRVSLDRDGNPLEQVSSLLHPRYFNLYAQF